MKWKFWNRRSFLTSLGGLPLLAAPGAGGAAARSGSGARDVIGRSEAVVNLRVQIARHFLLAAPGPGTGQLHLILHSMAGAASLHAVNFGVLRAKAEPDAMLIDCTLPLSPVSAALDLKLGYTIGDALQDVERLDRTLLQSALARHPGSGLRILPLAADPADTVDHLSPESILTLVSRLRDFFPECIVDAGGVRHAGMIRGLAERATAIHLVTPQTIIGVQGARALIDGLGEDLLGRVTLIVEDHDPAILLAPQQIARTLGLERVANLPAAQAAMANALNAGEPLVLAEPDSRYALAMSDLAGLAPERAAAPSLVGRLAGLKGRFR